MWSGVAALVLAAGVAGVAGTAGIAAGGTAPAVTTTGSPDGQAVAHPVAASAQSAA
jgi:hypothetical protein